MIVWIIFSFLRSEYCSNNYIHKVGFMPLIRTVVISNF